MLCLSTRSIHQSYKDPKRFSTTRLPALACGWMSKELCLQRPPPPPPPYKLYCIPFPGASFWCPAQNQFNEMNLKKKRIKGKPQSKQHMVYLAEGISDMKGCWGASKVPDTDAKRLPLLGPVTSKRNQESHFRYPGRLPQHSFFLSLGPCCQSCLCQR